MGEGGDVAGREGGEALPGFEVMADFQEPSPAGDHCAVGETELDCAV